MECLHGKLPSRIRTTKTKYYELALGAFCCSLKFEMEVQALGNLRKPKGILIYSEAPGEEDLSGEGGRDR